MGRMATEKKLMGMQEWVASFSSRGENEKAEDARRLLGLAVEEMREGSYSRKGYQVVVARKRGGEVGMKDGVNDGVGEGRDEGGEERRRKEQEEENKRDGWMGVVDWMVMPPAQEGGGWMGET